MTTSASTRVSASKGAFGTVWKSLALAAAAVVTMSSQAATVFNSGTGQHNYNQCFACTNNPTISELGDIITLAGTDRTLTNVTVSMAQQTFTGVTPYFVDVSLKFYNVDGSLNTSLIATRTETVQIPSAGLFDLSFDFTGVVVPTTLYYGLSISSTFANADGLRFSLWDYWSQANFGDGQALPIGTDPGTVVSGGTNVSSVVYGRLASNPSVLTSSNASGLGNNSLALGFTPAIQITAVPEPETYALMLGGLLAIGSVVRRRSGK